jgi:ACT domain-containing protein
MKKELDTKKLLLAAFEQSKVIAEACRIVGVTPSTYYFHYYKNATFRRAVLEKRAVQLAERIAEAK